MLTIILDARPLVAACDRNDDHNAWATAEMLTRKGGFIVTSAAVAEATHLLRNGPLALAVLSAIIGEMTVEDPAPIAVLAEMQLWSTRMDYADACAVLLARECPVPFRLARLGGRGICRSGPGRA